MIFYIIAIIGIILISICKRKELFTNGLDAINWTSDGNWRSIDDSKSARDGGKGVKDRYRKKVFNYHKFIHDREEKHEDKMKGELEKIFGKKEKKTYSEIAAKVWDSQNVLNPFKEWSSKHKKYIEKNKHKAHEKHDDFDSNTFNQVYEKQKERANENLPKEHPIKFPDTDWWDPDDIPFQDGYSFFDSVPSQELYYGDPNLYNGAFLEDKSGYNFETYNPWENKNYEGKTPGKLNLYANHPQAIDYTVSVYN